jgi:hypothetical protein
MKKETVQLTKGSMQLLDEKCFAKVTFAEGDIEKQTPTLEMLAYSGGIIKGHWWWGDLAIDLEGMKFPKKKYPLLEDHETGKKIGFITKLSTEGNQLTVVGAEFIDTEESIKFRENSAQGFPYEASIYARPTKIQTLQEKETAMVNGYEMKGPGTIWRECTFKESSVCTFGYDSNTKSAAMSESEDVCIEISSVAKFQEQEEVKMDYLKFKTEHPEEFAKLAKEVADGVEAKFAGEKADLESKLANVTEQNAQLSEESKLSEKRLLALEKSEALRQEQSMKHTADNIFAQKFTDAGLPERLSAKVRKMVGHEAFIADGILDEEAFAASVDAELKDWSDEEGSVMGFSTSKKDLGTGSKEKLSKESDAAAERMLAYVK